jgi:DNA-binding MarR family transcriptional regulator
MGSKRVGAASQDERMDAERAALLIGAWNIGCVFRDLHRAGRDILMERIALRGIGVGAFYYLWALYQEDGIGQNELAKRVRNVGPTATSILSGMERNGLVTRLRNHEDKRVVRVYLTEKAKELRPTVELEVAKVNERSLSFLSDTEIETLTSLLGKVGRALLG